jgi:signal transduction histidine kinase
VTFTVRPPVWRRWWFLAGVAFLLAGFGYGAEALRWRRRRQLDSVRARIASDLHDDLGAGLTRISILAEVAARRSREGSPADDLLESIGLASRGVVESLSDGIWAVDPRRDDLKSLGERLRQAAAELLEPAGIAWRVEVPAGAERIRLEPDRRRQIYLIVKEALANAARHSGGKNARLRIATGQGRLVIELADDGKGLSPGAAEGERGLVGGRGLGNMRERARALGGSLEISGEGGRGTTVRLDVPGPHA